MPGGTLLLSKRCLTLDLQVFDNAVVTFCVLAKEYYVTTTGIQGSLDWCVPVGEVFRIHILKLDITYGRVQEEL